MVKQLKSALLMLAVLMLVTGVIYPLSVTVLAQALFPAQANGSLIERDGQVVGSALIGQGIDDPRYFSSRPSAVNYMLGTTPESLGSSGATNYGWTNATLAEQVAERETAIRSRNGLSDGVTIPPDLLFASGSGLDPHISPEAARLQVNRVAEARGMSAEQVDALVTEFIEAPQFGILGQPRVNVLLLNLALDQLQ